MSKPLHSVKAENRGVEVRKLDSMCLYMAYDTVAEKYGPPFHAVNDAVAVRTMRNWKLPTPADYELKRIAVVDMETARVIDQFGDIPWREDSREPRMALVED